MPDVQKLSKKPPDGQLSWMVFDVLPIELLSGCILEFGYLRSYGQWRASGKQFQLENESCVSYR